jgi:hypothetical protein
MTSLEMASLFLLGISGVLSAAFLYLGRGRAISLVFLYLLAYQGMEMFLKWEKVNYFNDISYISLALAIDMFAFYIFLHRSLHFLALIIGFDVLYAGINLLLLSYGVGVLDVIYGHVGISVSILLLIGGVGRGIRPGRDPVGDSWDFSYQSFKRALPFGKRAKG